jgi:hypothetical protein
MKTSYNLRLPQELCEKIEREAVKNNVSINQYIMYTLTKSSSYNDAFKQLHKKLKGIPELDTDTLLSGIPDQPPLPGDEL